MNYTDFLLLLEDRGMNAYGVSKATGIYVSAFTEWRKKGVLSSYPKLKKLADFFGMSIDQLVHYGDTRKENPRITPCNEENLAPVLGKIAAGQPIVAIRNADTYLYADCNVKNGTGEFEYFYLEVQGGSMVNAGIPDGSRVLIHRQPCAVDGQIVACMLEDEDVTLKRYFETRDYIILQHESDDPSNAIPPIPKSQFALGRARILGVATKVLRNLQ